MARKPGEVPFSGQVWLKRWIDQWKWFDIREEQVIREAKRAFPYDWERMLHNAKEGLMGLSTKYADYIWLPDPAYQDELPLNSYLLDAGKLPR